MSPQSVSIPTFHCTEALLFARPLSNTAASGKCLYNSKAILWRRLTAGEGLVLSKKSCFPKLENSCRYNLFYLTFISLINIPGASQQSSVIKCSETTEEFGHLFWNGKKVKKIMAPFNHEIPNSLKTSYLHSFELKSSLFGFQQEAKSLSQSEVDIGF